MRSGLTIDHGGYGVFNVLHEEFFSIIMSSWVAADNFCMPEEETAVTYRDELMSATVVRQCAPPLSLSLLKGASQLR